jgi:tetratricopeptide (TPR) repeat protein
VVTATAGALFYGLYKTQQASALAQRLDRRRRVDELVTRGHAGEAAGRFTEAKEGYGQALALLRDDPDLTEDWLVRRVEEAHARAQQKSDEQAQRQTAEMKRLAGRDDFRKRLQRFAPHRDAVLFHSVSFRSDAAADGERIRREAPAALAQFELSVERPAEFGVGLGRWRGLVEKPEQIDRPAAECYRILLVWAEAEPLPQPARALNLLGVAAALAEAHRLPAPRTFHLRRGRVLELLGDRDGARAEWQRATAVSPPSALDHFEDGLKSYREGRLKEAATSCEEVLRLEPDHLWGQYLKALCNLRAKRWGEAKVGLTAVLARSQRSPWPLMLRGIAHGGLLAERLKAGAGAKEPAGLQEFIDAEADFARALQEAADPALRAAVLTNRSAVRLQVQRWQDARTDLLKAIDLQPKAYQGYVNLAQAHQSRGELDAAVKALDRALELHQDAALYNTRARLQVRRGDRAAARRDFEQVLARQRPETRKELLAGARVELAELKHQDGAFEAALADCDAALLTLPDYAPAQRQRAKALLASKRYREAGESLDRFLAVERGNPKAYQARGLIHAGRGEHLRAIESYTRALLLKADTKDRAATLVYRGWAYLYTDSPRPALADFDAALDLETRNTDALCGRGTARVQLAREKASFKAEEAAAEVRSATADAEAVLRQKPGPARQLLLDCARVYSRAIAVLQVAGRPVDRRRADYCRHRALELLRDVLEQVPPAQRVAFWRTTITGDTALQALRNTEGLQVLAARYAR